MTLERCMLILINVLFIFWTNDALAYQWQTIQQRHILRVAIAQEFPPFGTVGTGLQPQGYDIDVAHYLAGNMKLELQMVPITSVNRIPYLQTDKVDLVISCLGKSAEREKVIDFSRAYAPFFSSIFGPKGDDVTAMSDLGGKTISVTRSSIEDMVLSDLVPRNVQIRRYEDNNTTLSAYLSKQVQYVAIGNFIVNSVVWQTPEQKPEVKFTLNNSPCYIGLHKNESRLKEKVNVLIEQTLQDHTLNKLSEKWLKEPLPVDFGH